MKKIIVLVLIAFALTLTGCRLEESNKGNDFTNLPQKEKETDSKKQANNFIDPASTESVTTDTLKNSVKKQLTDSIKEQQETDSVKEQTTDSVKEQVTDINNENITDDWFVGFIGNKKIYAKFDISEDRISGVYHDGYKTNIELKGYFNSITAIKGFRTFELWEETDDRGDIIGIFRTDDYIQGCWIKDDVIYPMHLTREGTDITPPQKPSSDAIKYEGTWTGKSSGFFTGSKANVKALFDDLIYYELSAFNGANSGLLNSFAFIENNVAKTVYENDINIGEKEDIVFEFSVENDLLHLNSNDYSFFCGMGVFFDSHYVKGEIEIKMPTALDVGIVDTKEQDELFKKLVGDRYDDFITYTSTVFYSKLIWNDKEVKAGEAYLRGYSGKCFYIISDEHIYAAINENKNVYYYTNDKNYADNIPEPMVDWVNERLYIWMEDDNGGKIFYNYKDL
jgi:hypothetical protein